VTGAGPRRGWAAVLLATALALAGCSSGDPRSGTAAGIGAPDPPVATLAFQAPTLDGGGLDAATLAGTPLVLWFWAPWCTICRAEAPDVAGVAAEYAGRVQVIGVAGRGDVASMRKFVTDTGTGNLVHVVDQDGAVWNRFGVVSQPTFVFVDAAGNTESFAGTLAGGQLDAFVDDLL
jgi:thiol-disulfide isomerase/thioredoxin